MGVSRTPLREALIRLEQEELITCYEQARGFFVKHFSLQEVHDLYEYREILENAVAGKIIAKVTQQNVERLAGMLEAVNRTIENNRPDEVLALGMDFHLYIARICDANSFIISALRNCYEKLIVISWNCQDVDACTSSSHEHKKIIQAIESRDPGELLKWQQLHVHRARDRILNLVKDSFQKLYFVP